MLIVVTHQSHATPGIEKPRRRDPLKAHPTRIKSTKLTLHRKPPKRISRLKTFKHNTTANFSKSITKMPSTSDERAVKLLRKAIQNHRSKPSTPTKSPTSAITRSQVHFNDIPSSPSFESAGPRFTPIQTWWLRLRRKKEN